MSNVLIVAAREFRQIIAMKSFWLTLLLIPVALALGPILGSTLQDDEATGVMLVDRSGGGAARAVQHRFAIEQDRATLISLAHYVRRHDLGRADPQAVWAQPDRWYTEADIIAFREAGGIDAALTRITAVRDDGTPGFEPPMPDYRFVPPPARLAQAQGDALDREVDQVIDPQEGEAPADYVVLMGEEYPQRPVVRLWSNDTPRAAFVTTLQDVLTTDLRARMLAAQGVSPQAGVEIQRVQPVLQITTPPPGNGVREALFVRSIVPLALAYILMMSLMLSGSWMLQSSVEERSNKLLESLLACIRPEELMWGKLVGTVAIGLSMILFWTLCASVAVFASQGVVADYIRPALAPVSSPAIILAVIYFFVAGYIAISIIFLAVGSMSNSMSEAQGYLMPVLFAILLPVTFVLQAVLSDNSASLVHALTWIPLWTPFTVLARLGAGIELWELVGSGLVLAGFIIFEFIYLGRMFRASLLASGQKPGIRILLERLKGRPA